MIAERGTDLRPCITPGQSRGRMCPFAHVCFDGWEPDHDTETITDPHIVTVAQALHAIKQEKRQHAQAVKALEEAEKEAQAELAEVVEREALVGPYVVKRSPRTRKPTFKPEAYEAAGHSLDALSEFFSGGSSFDVWKVEMAAEAGEIDYGEAPF